MRIGRKTREREGNLCIYPPGRGKGSNSIKYRSLFSMFEVTRQAPREDPHTFDMVLLQPLNRTVHKYLLRRKGERETQTNHCEPDERNALPPSLPAPAPHLTPRTLPLLRRPIPYSSPSPGTAHRPRPQRRYRPPSARRIPTITTFLTERRKAFRWTCGRVRVVREFKEQITECCKESYDDETYRRMQAMGQVKKAGTIVVISKYSAKAIDHGEDEESDKEVKEDEDEEEDWGRWRRKRWRSSSHLSPVPLRKLVFMLAIPPVAIAAFAHTESKL